ncbi:alpha/beta hydrolase family esterase [Amorphus orientalis]|uniref:Polyhydroxybutyrate depolymerase n=1 Tax=Amorphus orientalis TaxID=649198 RepID=A0AAE4AT76_9HYPH|nr:PHB depolymerase family esterase [Amorphus orientalis]MDQ0315988.1 polyhydroxybutyrate depolymerase [Amorphus orientalis]
MTHLWFRTGLIPAAIFFCLSTAAAAAGTMECPDPDGCTVDGGSYRAYMPADLDGKSALPVLVYFHGWQGSAEGVMKNEGLKAAADELGVLLIAPDGADKTWSFPGSPSQERDETAFVDAVMDDVADRFPIDPDKTVATGFSMGGSMAWFVACDLGDRFAGFIPVAGAYWDPIPSDCASPVPNLVHVHGTSDTVVPMEGRPIREIYRQSDVEDSLATWTTKAGCDAEPVPASLGDLACRKWTGCGTKLIELCTHPGGHLIEPQWIVDGYHRLMDPAR